MKKTSVILKSFLFSSVALCIVLLLIAEFGRSVIGKWDIPPIAEFYINIVLELVTLCFIPLALRLFKFKRISQSLGKNREKALLKWGCIRMAMLCLPMIANMILFALTDKAAYFYMAVILFLCLFFIYPSMARCVAEVTPQEHQ